jgi:hypothetical protein
MDPIMWDPFRYKLGGRLLDGSMREFSERYGVREDGRYLLARDLATYAIIKEVEAGRGSSHGGAYLSFEHCSAEALREAFGQGDRSAGTQWHRLDAHAGHHAPRSARDDLEPLRNKAWIRDLVSEIAPPAERLIPPDKE